MKHVQRDDVGLGSMVGHKQAIGGVFCSFGGSLQIRCYLQDEKKLFYVSWTRMRTCVCMCVRVCLCRYESVNYLQPLHQISSYLFKQLIPARFVRTNDGAATESL